MYGTRRGDEEYIYLTVKGGVKARKNKKRLLTLLISNYCKVGLSDADYKQYVYF